MADAGRPGVTINGNGPLGRSHEVDLVSPISETGPAGLGEHVGERGVVGVAEGAVHLDGPVDYPIQGVGHEVLCHGDLGPEVDLVEVVVGGVDEVRGVQHHELRLVQLDG